MRKEAYLNFWGGLYRVINRRTQVILATSTRGPEYPKRVAREKGFHVYLQGGRVLKPLSASHP